MRPQITVPLWVLPLLWGARFVANVVRVVQGMIG
jgi:hypothetical protein